MPGMHGQRPPCGFKSFQKQFATRKKTKGEWPRSIFGHRATTGINQLSDRFSQFGEPAFQSS